MTITEVPPKTDVSSKDGSPPAEQHTDEERYINEVEEAFHSDEEEFDEEFEIEW